MTQLALPHPQHPQHPQHPPRTRRTQAPPGSRGGRAAPAPGHAVRAGATGRPVVAAGPRAAGGGRAGASGRLAGGLAWGLGGAAVGGAGAGLLLLALAPAAAWPAGLRATLPTFVAFTLAFAPFAAVGAFLAARRPRHSTGWLFLAIGLLSGASALANGWRAYAPVAGWGAPPAVVQWLAVGGRALLLQGLAAVVLGFPDGRLPGPRWRPAAWLVGASLAADLVASALAPHRLFTVSFRAARDTAPGGAAGAPAADGLLGAVAGLAGALAGPLEAAVAVVAAAAVLWRLRRARGTERRQLQWLAYCVALAAGGLRRPLRRCGRPGRGGAGPAVLPAAAGRRAARRGARGGGRGGGAGRPLRDRVAAQPHAGLRAPDGHPGRPLRRRRGAVPAPVPGPHGRPGRRGPGAEHARPGGGLHPPEERPPGGRRRPV